MELLVASGLAVRRLGGAGDHLFANVDLRVAARDRIGLAGPNGSGKSTLLRLLAFEVSPTEGTVVRAPGVSTALLHQDAGHRLLSAGHGRPGTEAPRHSTVWQVAAAALTEVERAERRLREAEAAIAVAAVTGPSDPAMRELQLLAAEHERLGGYGAAARVREILAALGFDEGRHGVPVTALSDGERQRLALAAVLAAHADVLLLDEPTNHLDMGGRAWLERHLSRRQGAAVIISHDRALLDAATNRTAFLSVAGLKLSGSSYTRAARTLAASEAQATRRARELHKEAARLEQVAEELAAHGAKAQARRRRASRDGAALRARAAAAATDAVPAAPTSRPVRLASHPRRTDGRAGGGAGARGHVTRGRLLEAEHLSFGALLDDVSVRIDAGDHIALLGPNGSGKSTLLALLAGDLAGEDPRQRVWYAPAMKLVRVDQRARGLQPGVPVLDQGSARLGLEPARRVLAGTGLPFASWTRPPEELSGGERARVGLALALAQPFDLLLLDEPDNDLDLAAVEGLEAGLAARLSETGAALVIATHDRRLARAVAGRVWSIRDGGLCAHGGVPAYLRGEAAVPAADFWQGTGAQVDLPAELAAAAARTLDQLELEHERAQILARLSDPLALGERESDRLTERLLEVESSLMSTYDAALEPAAPRYRLVERGLTLFADTPPGHAGAAARGVAPSRADEQPPATGGDRAGDLLVVAAVDGARATAALARTGPDAPWLEVRLNDQVAHLRIGASPDACLLPATTAALVDAGTRLAFTVMGARSVQAFSRADLSSTYLAPVGDGWWRSSLRQFLAAEGWAAAGAAPRAAGDPRGAGASSPPGGRQGRRGRRKAVDS